MATRIPPDTPFREAGALYMREQNARISRHLPGTLAGEDPEELHDMRVATRRLRAAMLVFQSCFEAKVFRKWYRRVSRLTRALGEVRDMDVQMAAVTRRSDGLPDDLRADVDAWLAAHAGRREEARAEMIAAIQEWRDKNRGPALDGVLRGVEGAAPVRALAAEARRLLLDRCAATGNAAEREGG